MATNPEQQAQEESQERRELIDAIEELNEKVERGAESSAKAADKIADATDRMSRVVRSADELGKASLSLTKTGLVVSGAALTLQQAHKRGQLGNLAKGAAGLSGIFAGGVGGARQGRGILTTLTKTVLLLSNLHPALKALAAATVGLLAFRRRRTQGGTGDDSRQFVEESEQQTRLLRGLLSEAKKRGKSLNRLQAERQAELDPFARGPQFQQRRLQQIGASITALQARELGNLKSVLNDLAASQESNARISASAIAPVRTALVGFKLELSRAAGVVKRFWLGQRGDPLRTVTPGGGGTRALGSYLKDYARNLVPGSMVRDALTQVFDMGKNFQLGRVFGDNRSIFQLNDLLKNFLPNFSARSRLPERQTQFEGPLGGAAARRMFELQTLGPGNIINAPATVRAGGESEYQFRVQQQRRQLQREQTMKWQQEMLDTMRQLVAQGRMDLDDLFRARFTFEGVW